MDKGLIFLNRLRAVVNTTVDTDEITTMCAVGVLEILKKELCDQLVLEDVEQG